MATETALANLTEAGSNVPANGDPVGNTTCLCEAAPRKKIPIIFVPGVMGSRLHFTAINQSWDPDDNWAMFHWLNINAEQARTEMHRNRAVTIMGAHGDLSEEEVTHGYGGVAMGFYVPFLRYLRMQQFNLNVDTPVWAIGYDWRQSNKVSGDFVTREVNRIMGVEGASQVILLSHSMGGMVTRSAMKSALEGSVLGVVHIYQPVDGAVVMYRRFFTGATAELDPSGDGWFGMGLNSIIGNDGVKYTTISSGMPGPLQLLPTNNYKDTGGAAWLKYREAGVVSSWSGDVYDLYNGALNPPALPAPGVTPVVLTDLRTHVSLAKSFHAELAHYQHPKTKTIHSTGLLADMAVLFDPPTQPAPVTTTVSDWIFWEKEVTTTPAWTNRGAQREARETSDGTVPNTSANPLKPNIELTGVEHSAACNDGPTRDQVKLWIEEFLA